MSTPPRFTGSARPSDIDGVIAALEAIVDWSWRAESRLGFFCQVYLSTTRAVKAGITAGEFEDGPRLARFDVIFALRYLDAFSAFVDGRAVPASWSCSFEADRDHELLVVQHVLLGMNAHINLDLGVAAAEVAPGPAIAGLRGDFDRVNELLARMIDRVELALGVTSPALRIAGRLAGDRDREAIDWSIRAARRAAWESATNLADKTGEQRAASIDALDRRVARLGELVVGDRLSRAATAPLRWVERRRPREVIDALRQI